MRRTGPRTGRRSRGTGRCRQRWPGRGDAGLVTAETAVVLPALAVVLLLALWAVGAVVVQLRCQDAARLTARALARGEPAAVARAIGHRAGPSGAEIRLEVAAGLVSVDVRTAAALPGPWGGLAPRIPVRGTAVADVEGR